MYGGKVINTELDDDTLVFEYVIGTLRGDERLAFEARLNSDDRLQDLLAHWEEELMSLHDTEQGLAPKADTWDAIEQRLFASENEKELPSVWARLWPFNEAKWLVTSMLASLFLIVLFVRVSPIGTTALPTVDYVAVMTANDGTHSLTTTASASTKVLQLTWGAEALSEHQDYQLWAVSKRDGYTRSLAVIADKSTGQIQLSDAHWRLIIDAESLLLTVEEEGGSALDEPSNLLVAQGICVRLNSGV